MRTLTTTLLLLIGRLASAADCRPPVEVLQESYQHLEHTDAAGVKRLSGVFIYVDDIPLNWTGVGKFSVYIIAGKYRPFPADRGRLSAKAFKGLILNNPAFAWKHFQVDTSEYRTTFTDAANKKYELQLVTKWKFKSEDSTMVTVCP